MVRSVAAWKRTSTYLTSIQSSFSNTQDQFEDIKKVSCCDQPNRKFVQPDNCRMYPCYGWKNYFSKNKIEGRSNLAFQNWPNNPGSVYRKQTFSSFTWLNFTLKMVYNALWVKMHLRQRKYCMNRAFGNVIIQSGCFYTITYYLLSAWKMYIISYERIRR